MSKGQCPQGLPNNHLGGYEWRSLLTLPVSPEQAMVVGCRWAAAWSQTDSAVWKAIYAPNAIYTDYAFMCRRRGKAGMEDHFNIWRKSNSDFKCEVLSAGPGVELPDGKVKYSTRTSNKGTFVNDLPRMKATQKKFDFTAVVDITVRAEDGLIEDIEEWYCRQFDSTMLEA